MTHVTQAFEVNLSRGGSGRSSLFECFPSVGLGFKVRCNGQELSAGLPDTLARRPSIALFLSTHLPPFRFSHGSLNSSAQNETRGPSSRTASFQNGARPALRLT